MKPFLEKAIAAESKQQYRMAVTIYEQVPFISQCMYIPDTCRSAGIGRLTWRVSPGRRVCILHAIQVLIKAPDSYEALFRLTRLWRLAKRPAEALKLAQVAVITYPEDVELAEQYADCLK